MSAETQARLAADEYGLARIRRAMLDSAESRRVFREEQGQLDAAIRLAEAGLAEHRASMALSEARIARLLAAEALIRAGDREKAREIIEAVRAEQEAGS